ncbi:TPA: hypothetical protein ACHUSD_004523, partial [Shigella flexneri]
MSHPALAIFQGTNEKRNTLDDIIDDITSKLNPNGACDLVPLNVRIIDVACISPHKIIAKYGSRV